MTTDEPARRQTTKPLTISSDSATHCLWVWKVLSHETLFWHALGILLIVLIILIIHSHYSGLHTLLLESWSKTECFFTGRRNCGLKG